MYALLFQINEMDTVTVPCHVFLYATYNRDRLPPDDKGPYGKPLVHESESVNQEIAAV